MRKIGFILFFFFTILFSVSGQNSPILVNYSFEPAVQHFVVPPGVSIITVTIAGAQGGGYLGGKGASFTCICNVHSCHIISIVVGQRGDTNALGRNGGGGGGASWVYDSNIVLHIPTGVNGLVAVAAGGGGESWSWPFGYPYTDTTFAGSAGGIDLSTNSTTTGLIDGTGGTDGNGGESVGQILRSSGGGGGWLSNGTRAAWNVSGMDEANHFSGANAGGGFGGGGGFGEGNNGENIDFGGGGGGYNGGGAGGGGGGSYLNGTLVGVAVASNIGNGSVTISYQPTTGVEDCPQDIFIYPNPTSGEFLVAGVMPGQTLDVYDYLGQKIMSAQVSNTYLELNLSANAKGVYLVIAHNGDRTFAGQAKVVKIP